MRGHILRLQTIQRNMDMEEDEGVVDYMANNQQDSTRCESPSWTRSRKLVDMWAKQVVGRLKELGEGRCAHSSFTVAQNSTANNFAPIIGAKIEWLLAQSWNTAPGGRDARGRIALKMVSSKCCTESGSVTDDPSTTQPALMPVEDQQ